MNEEKDLEDYYQRQETYRNLERQQRYAELSDLKYENFGLDSDAKYLEWSSK